MEREAEQPCSGFAVSTSGEAEERRRQQHAAPNTRIRLSASTTKRRAFPAS
jgi:hypothetical protein